LAAHAAADPRDVAEPRGGVEPHVAAEQQLVGALALGIEGIGYGDPAPVDYSVTVGTDLRASGGPSDFPLTYTIGGDWRLGATSPGGFAYALTMWPVGIGVLVGETFFFGVLGGAGVSGVTTRVPASGQLETEARMLLDLPGPFLFIGSARTTWLAADERQDGAKTASFADESRAQLGVRIGHEGHSRKIEFGRGFFLAFEVREAFDTRGYGVTLAHQIDGMHAP
jgi:hypothetical protein